MRALVVVAMVSACWTGPVVEERPVAATAALRRTPTSLSVTLERTACMGACPTYRVEIDARQRLARFVGSANVAADGERVVRLSKADVSALDRKLAEVRFFERNESGRFPIQPTCTSDGTTTTCTTGATITLCSDSSAAVVTVHRGSQQHTIEDSCHDDADLVELEELIDRLAHSQDWIGNE